MHILWIYDYNRQPSLNNLKLYVDIGVLLYFHDIIILSYCILFMKTRQSGVLCMVWTVPRPISSRQWLWSKALGLTTPKVPRLLAAPCVKLSNIQASVSSFFIYLLCTFAHASARLSQTLPRRSCRAAWWCWWGSPPGPHTSPGNTLLTTIVSWNTVVMRPLLTCEVAGGWQCWGPVWGVYRCSQYPAALYCTVLYCTVLYCTLYLQLPAPVVLGPGVEDSAGVPHQVDNLTQGNTVGVLEKWNGGTSEDEKNMFAPTLMSDSLSQSLSALARTLITFTSRGQEEEHRDQLLAWTPSITILELSTGLCEILRCLVESAD